MHHNLCFNLFMIGNNSFDNQGSKINKFFNILTYYFLYFLKLGFTPCKAEQPLQSMELQKKKLKKDYWIHIVCFERTYS